LVYFEYLNMKVKLFMAALVLSSLSACAVSTPFGSASIDPNGGYYDGGNGGGHGGFCPPGQAKKGNC
jgi:hypothetical protein